jgi:methionine synthase II (cobalamin-independent)
MMRDLPPFLATGVGSLPHTDPEKAVRIVLSHLRDVPYWPQLPRMDFLETMYAQFAAGLPGAAIEGEKLFVESGEKAAAESEAFYERFLSEDPSCFAIPEERAAGLHRLLAADPAPCLAVKGQITGPVSFGLMVTDRRKRPLFYDPVGRDILVKHLLRVAQWQVAQLSRISPDVILVLDEPYLASVGSAILSLGREDVIGCLDEIFDGLPGALCGIHCCANTDWGLVLESRVRYLSFDAYEYADSLLLYPEGVKGFLGRGGKLAFGIVPTSPEAIRRETPESLAGRMEDILGKFEARGIPHGTVARAAFITPACGLGTLSEEEAERAVLLSEGLSSLLRGRHGEASR